MNSTTTQKNPVDSDSARAIRRIENRFTQPTPKDGVMLHPHCQENGKATVNLQLWSERHLPRGLTLEVYDDVGDLIETVELADQHWTNLGGKVLGKWARSVWIAHVDLLTLFEGRAFAVFAKRDDETVASAAYKPFPLIFPGKDEPPFVVFAGSCMDVERHGYKNGDRINTDIERFRAAIENAARSPEQMQPDLAVLLGDQVYLDQPVRYWRSRNSMQWLWNTFLRKYERSWTALDKVMANSLSVCLTDDHEYWNDYPNLPVRWGWPALRNRNYRRDVRRLTEQCAEAIQNTKHLRELVSYKGVNFVFLETRRWRETRSRRFCPDGVLDQAVHKLRYASKPTVLVLSQPIFSEPTSSHFWGTILGDRLLPSHRGQFERLSEAINESPHDVVVLAGDAHYSRVAQATLPTTDRSRSEHKVIEVISSPLLGLDAAPSRFDINEHGRGDVWPHESIAADHRTEITYLAASSPKRSDNSASLNNAVYLSFNRGAEPGTVSMNVRSVDLEKQARSSRSLAVDFSYDFLLR